MRTGQSRAPAEVCLLALPETTPTALYGLLELFASVGVTWGRLTGEHARARRMSARIVARRRRPFISALGVPITPQATLAEVERADVIVVTDLELPVEVDPRDRWPREAAWVRRRFDAGATVCSVCTGSIFLADAGLLDGREATTHWSATELLRRSYPAVQLRPERILCPTGPEHRVITSGGASSWEDLALYLVARFSSEAEAVRIAKIFLLGDRSEGQLPFAMLVRSRRHDDAVIAACQRWIAEHPAIPNPVQRMVQHARLAERTFKRRFKSATGYTPVEYVQALRVEAAKRLLETSAEPTDAVAHAVGYEDPAFFRRLFARSTGTTPARYRQRFGAASRPVHAMRVAPARDGAG